MKTAIYALHGFLGTPADWDPIRPPQGEFHALNLFSEVPIRSLPEWADAFNRTHRRKSGCFRVLMGYSLGGRLALHALLQAPRLWDAAVIISAHLGLRSHAEKLARQAHDAQWANRFENEPWDALMQAWEAQEIFQSDSYKFHRTANDYSRERLAAALRYWSLGLQENLTAQIAAAHMPILWIAGEKDDNCIKQTETLHFRHPRSKIWQAAGAGHRVAWQQPQEFLRQFEAFISHIQFNP